MKLFNGNNLQRITTCQEKRKGIEYQVLISLSYNTKELVHGKKVTVCQLTVVNSVAAFAAVFIEQSDAGDNHRQLVQLSLLVLFLQRQERSELGLW